MAFTASARGERHAADRPAPGPTWAREDGGELEYDAPVAPGVTVTWDPATPHHCVGFSVDHSDGEVTTAVNRVPWLRLAAVETLGHWLYLPLSRALLDAELAAAQVGAAWTLPPGTATRKDLTRKAFVHARRASQGVVHVLERFAGGTGRPPPALEASLATLVNCYTTLLNEVRRRDDEPDAKLAAVPATWNLLRGLDGRATERRTPAARTASVPQPGRAFIDPRQVPARILRLGSTADAAEIGVVTERWAGGCALRVRVPEFETEPSPQDVADVGIRLVDRRSGHVHGYGMLGRRAAGRGGDRYLEGLVVLPDSVGAEDVRVDVYAIGERAAPPVDGEQLRRVRRATLFLSDWRALVADVRLWGADATPAARLRTIIRRLPRDGDRRHAGQDKEALWAGGPSRSDLRRLAALDDPALAAMLQPGAPAGSGPIIEDNAAGATTILPMVSGPGELLAAELAAAYERSLPT
jgi:hypothetical protein